MPIQKNYFWILPSSHTWNLFTLLLLFNIGKEKKNKIKLSEWEFKYCYKSIPLVIWNKELDEQKFNTCSIWENHLIDNKTIWTSIMSL